MHFVRPGFLAMTAWSIALTAGCRDNAGVRATATSGGTSAASETATAQQNGTRTVVPSVTREVTNPGSPTSAGPPGASTVTIADAFPRLPGVDRPVVLAEIPGEDAFLVVSQEGMVYAFAKDADAAALNEALDWTDRTARSGNEEGLLGLALSPEFAVDHYVYLYYSAADGERRSVISRFATSGEGTGIEIDPASELVILVVPQPYPNHNGGNIVFGPDGLLYIGLGDGGSGGDPQGNSQDPSTLLGSILRIDVSHATASAPYAIPADNPAIGVPGARPETFAYGFRNPWRYGFDRQTGDLWVGDVGQERREEIDLVEAGKNYGWNIMEGFECYEAASCNQAGLELPVVDYGREGGHCSVTGGYVARGARAGTLSGWYVYADFCSGSVWAINAVEAGSSPEPVELRESGPQITSFAEDADGELYLLSFDGRIYRIEG